jgi:acyl-CoA reductase-like NAD-dependent aldehyde dehydrogenase
VRRFGLLVGGRLAHADGVPLRVVNPATEEIIAEAPDATDQQLGEAIEAASRAFITWRAIPIGDRRRTLSGIAFSLVNSSDYGLGGSVWGRDIEAAQGVAERIDCGVVWVNEPQRVAPDFPMAGHEASGIGAENGIEGLLHYTQPHVISVRTS